MAGRAGVGVTVAIGGRPHTHGQGILWKARIRVLVATLTREWFHSGSAVYNVAGPGSDEFAGTLELGYQIGFPRSPGVGINLSYTTPNILIDHGNFANAFAQRPVTASPPTVNPGT